MTKVNQDVVVDGKRTRKPKVMFAPEDFSSKPPQANVSAATKKPRNQAVKGAQNKWETYHKVFKQAVETIVRQDHYMEVRALQKSSLRSAQDQEDAISRQKIFAAKRTIFGTLHAIAAENSGDTVWPQLGGADDEAMVDVSSIMCSRCGGEEEPSNDILFCDHKDCCRAYHQQCLDPPIDPSLLAVDGDWFCWQCECMDICLDLLGERLGIEFYDYRQVFPEVAHTFDASGMNPLPLTDQNDTFHRLDDDDDEEDEDYLPDDDEDDQSRSDCSGVSSDGESGSIADRDEERKSREDGESAEESEIDEEELTGLLQDAQADIGFTTISDANPSTSSSSGHRLRPRRTHQDGSSSGRSDDDLRVYGENDVGRYVAKVHRGVVVVGRVAAFAASETSPWQGSNGNDEEVVPRPTSTSPKRERSAPAPQAGDKLEDTVAALGRWLVRFEDGSEAQLSHTAVVSALRLHAEHETQCEAIRRQAAQKQAVEALGKVSEENVLQDRRAHRAVDYAALSMEMFGNLWDEEDQRVSDASDLEHDRGDTFRETSRQRGKKSGRRRSRAQEKTGQHDEDEDEDGSDHSTSQRRRQRRRRERSAKS